MKHLPTLLSMFCIILPCITAEQPTWVEIDNTIYGAKPDKKGPIGGGTGYANIIVKGDYIVKDLDELLEALSKAKAGQTVFVPADTVIDLSRYSNRSDGSHLYRRDCA